MIEYAVPVHWEQVTEEELRQLMLQTRMEAGEDDAKLMSEAFSESQILVVRLQQAASLSRRSKMMKAGGRR